MNVMTADSGETRRTYNIHSTMFSTTSANTSYVTMCNVTWKLQNIATKTTLNVGLKTEISWNKHLKNQVHKQNSVSKEHVVLDWCKFSKVSQRRRKFVVAEHTLKRYLKTHLFGQF